MSLSSRLLLLGAFPAVVMFVALMAFFTSARLDDARGELAQTSQMLADSLAPALEYAVVAGNSRALEQIVEQSLQRSEAEWIRVTDVIGENLGFVSNGDASGVAEDHNYSVYTAEILQEPVEIGNGDLLNGSWSGNSGSLRVGTVEVGVNPRLLEARQQEILWASITVGGVVFAITLLLVNYFLKDILRPIHKLARRVSRLIQGDYQTQSVAVKGNAKEVVEIQQQLNELANHLAQLEQDRDQTLAISENARQKAEHANQAKSGFLTAMSTELRTPLHGVLKTLDALREDPLSERQNHYLRTVRQSTEDLLTVISDILDHAHLDNGVFAPDTQAFDLRKLVENCTASLRLAAEQRAVSLDMELQGGWPESVMVLGDASRVRQILAGLVENAVNFSGDDFVSIRAHLSSVDHDRVLLNCTVTDSGSRMTSEQLDNVFGHSGDNPAYGGIGLSVVQRLVELMGGYIKVGSETGQDSSICFELAFDLADAENSPE
ncbi:MAG: sensor histidine kinase [Pseudomonadota bacterium]